MDPWIENPTDWSERYHVPRSQVWEGSRGGQSGNVHLHVPLAGDVRLLARAERVSWLTRRAGRALCGKGGGWYERPPLPGETEDRCSRCDYFAARYGVTWPNNIEVTR